MLLVHLTHRGEIRGRPHTVLLCLIEKGCQPFCGFTDEELDFVINYDINYRIGQVSDNSK
jgi:hypothetical protein